MYRQQQQQQQQQQHYYTTNSWPQTGWCRAIITAYCAKRNTRQRPAMRSAEIPLSHRDSITLLSTLSSRFLRGKRERECVIRVYASHMLYTHTRARARAYIHICIHIYTHSRIPNQSETRHKESDAIQNWTHAIGCSRCCLASPTF